MIVTSLTARWRLFRIAARMNRRRRRARLLRSPFAGLMSPRQRCDEIVLVPSDLRSPDPHFAAEVKAGHVVLAGETVELRGASPFTVENASLAWKRELQGFGWLNNLAAAGSEGRALARELVADWIGRRHPPATTAQDLDVSARRVISWLSHSGLLLDGAEPAEFRAVMASLAHQLRHISIRRHEELPGEQSLLAAMALLLADLSLAGREPQIDATERTFLSELASQILPDGGHIGRNPGVVLSLLLDLLPLRRCYPVRHRDPPPALVSAIDRMTGYLRAMRLGDGSLACFNGMGSTPLDALATMLTIETSTDLSALSASRYVRLTSGDLVLVMDCGTAPPAEFSTSAQSGCLSFELSDGPSALIVNAGMPSRGSPEAIALARASASHSTLTLDGRSSARLVPNRALDLVAERSALVGPPNVTCDVPSTAGTVAVKASHDGYLASHQLVHTRNLDIAADGAALSGVDRLAGRQGPVRLRNDVAFAIRFHLAPGCHARLAPSAATSVDIATTRGKLWRLTVEGAEASVEPSQINGRHAGTRPSTQIVLRGVTPGDSTISWRLARADG